MNPAHILLILELIEKTVSLAPEVSELIRKAKAGEEITQEELERTQALVDNAVSEWDNA